MGNHEENRIGDWLQTFSGLAFWPLDPRPEEIKIEDIAHSLSLLCRYGGHCLKFYSVAEHSIRVSKELPEKLKLWGLLHDATEAYLIDLPRPLKRFSNLGKHYQEAENQLEKVICKKFGLVLPMPIEVKEMDNKLLLTEKRDLLAPQPRPWREAQCEKIVEPLEDVIIPMKPKEAEIKFLSSYFELVDKNSGKHQPFEYDPS